MKKITNTEYIKILIDMLVFIDKICRKNNIKYSLIGGTMIGAVREGKMIPWDDDIDIILDKNNYDKLIDILIKNNNSKYKCITYENQADYYSPFAKLINTSTIIKEKHYKKINDYGVFLDIFRYDKTSNNYFLRLFHYYQHYFYKFLLGAHVYDTSAEKDKLKKIRNYISKKIGLKRVLNKYDKICQKYNNKQTKYITSNWNVYGFKKEIQKTENFKDFIDIEFEGHQVMITKNYHEILTTTFGDYMTPPPEDQQIQKHGIEAYWKE